MDGGVLGVLFGVLGVLFGGLGVLVDVLDLLVGIVMRCICYILVCGMVYLVFSSTKSVDLCLTFFEHTLLKTVPFKFFVILSTFQNIPSPAKNSEFKCKNSFLLLRVSCAVVGLQGTCLCLAESS